MLTLYDLVCMFRTQSNDVASYSFYKYSLSKKNLNCLTIGTLNKLELCY